MIMKVTITHSKPSQQQRVKHSTNPSLCCGLDSLLSLLRGNASSLGKDYGVDWWFSDCTYQCYVDLDLRFKCSCKIIIIHNISSIICQWVWDNCTDKYWSSCCCGRDTDLSLMIGHLILSFWIFVGWWIPRWLFINEMYLRDIIILILYAWRIHIKVIVTLLNWSGMINGWAAWVV